MSYGRTAPDGIPQDVWDEAIADWLEDSTTIDSSRIMRIATRKLREIELAPDVLKRWWPDATETVNDE